MFLLHADELLWKLELSARALVHISCKQSAETYCSLEGVRLSVPDVSRERRCLQTSPEQLMATKDKKDKNSDLSSPGGSGVSRNKNSNIVKTQIPHLGSSLSGGQKFPDKNWLIIRIFGIYVLRMLVASMTGSGRATQVLGRDPGAHEGLQWLGGLVLALFTGASAHLKPSENDAEML